MIIAGKKKLDSDIIVVVITLTHTFIQLVALVVRVEWIF